MRLAASEGDKQRAALARAGLADRGGEDEMHGGCSSAEGDASELQEAVDALLRLASHIQLWVNLQCRPLLNSTVFPLLATLTGGVFSSGSFHVVRAIEPQYRYVLCQTEGGVVLSDEQRDEFADSLSTIADGAGSHSIYPLQLRPTAGLFAIQPHLPSGYLELPTSALTLAGPHFFSRFGPLPALHSDPSTASRGASSLLVDLSQSSVEVFYHCLAYLDTNSLLFGLLPALHSLPAVTAALTHSTYGRRVLLARYGAWSDTALWSAELLSEWRREGFEQQRGTLKERYPAGIMARSNQPGKSQAFITKLCQQIDRQESGANEHEVHWAAVIDLQTRINRYLIRVMLQRKEDILPQLYQRPPAAVVQQQAVSGATQPVRSATARPIYLTVPDAAMELLLCVPPFHPLPAVMDEYAVITDGECPDGADSFHNATADHVDFAGVLRVVRTWPAHSKLLSLYMGPVYAYDNEYTAGRGVAVDTSGVASRRDAWGELLVERGRDEFEPSRGVRLLFIDDVNQLPVARHANYCTYLFAPTLAACFTAQGVTDLIRSTRAEWRRIAEGRTESESSSDKQQQLEDEQEVAEEQESKKEEEEEEKKRATVEQTVNKQEDARNGDDEHGEDEEGDEDDEEEDDEDEDEDEEDEDDMDDVMFDRDGCAVEYVDCLMMALLQDLEKTMWKNSTWTPAVAERAAVVASSIAAMEI